MGEESETPGAGPADGSGKSLAPPREPSRIAERRRRRRRWWIAALLVAALLGSFACSHVRYVSQSLGGGAKILLQREPIDSLLAQGDLAPRLRTQLEIVERVRTFARDELELPVGKAYGSYVETGRPFVAWNVVAAPADSIEPRTWCFPIAGCVAYRGYFREERARRYADGIAAEGWDVAVGGVTAYSTLGWFADPVLDTFAFLPEVDLAGLIFHELAHRKLYVSGDTAFNESFASFVEQLGERLYVEAQGSEGAERFGPDSLARRAQLRHRSATFTDLVLGARTCLEQVYGLGLEPSETEREKQRIFDDLRARYAEVRVEWLAEDPDGPVWDAWFEQELNNAHVASVGSYSIWVDALGALFDRAGGLLGFYDDVAALAERSQEERDETLRRLGPPDSKLEFGCRESVGRRGAKSPAPG